MTTLRVLLGAPPDPAVAVPWALFDDAGRLQASGIDAPRHWPASSAREAVLTSDAVRIVALELPPMPAARRAVAAGFAIEDQLAGPLETQAIAVAEHEADGVTLARITTRALLATLARCEPAFARIVAEPDLAEPSSGWRWCARDQGGFVRRADGSAFAIGPHSAEGDVPSELAIALAQAARNDSMPDAIDVETPCDPERCVQWQQRYGVPFHRGSPWRWERSARFARAPDLRPALATPRSALRTPRIARLFRPAIVLLLLAAVLHVVATAGTWIARRVELARVDRELFEVATQAGLKDVAANDPGAAIGRAFRQARHAVGLTSPGDAVPLLARIARPMAALPGATLKSATYSSAAWTLELAPIDDALVSRLVRQLAADDLPVVHARTPAGVRVRVGPVR